MIASLPPIGLDELVSRAPLLVRVDRKYILREADLSSILSGLSTDVRVLEIDKRRDFAYRSRYFDTPSLESYLGAAHGRRRRYKVRVRSYLDSDLHFLEVKTRGPRGTTVKQRAPYDGDGERLRDGDLDYIAYALRQAGVQADPGGLRPMLTSCYRRTTLFVPGTGSRVTIDTGLTWTLADGAEVRTRDRAIVETKSDQRISDIDRLLWSYRHRPCAVSKYGTGLAALRPDLPAHHWRPVLRKHFRRLHLPVKETTT